MKIRIPAALKEQIEAAARASNRSLNGEIVLRLGKSFVDQDNGDVGLAEVRAEIMAEIETLRQNVRQQDTRLYALENAKTSNG